MDNFHIDITSDTNLKLALQLVLDRHIPEGYKILKDKGLVFYWAEPYPIESYNKFPFKPSLEYILEFINLWLKEQNYGSQPDHDGDNDKGWRIYNESWGHVNSEWQAFFAVQPVWAMYGK